jgi:hypothetical protein
MPDDRDTSPESTPTTPRLHPLEHQKNRRAALVREALDPTLAPIHAARRKKRAQELIQAQRLVKMLQAHALGLANVDLVRLRDVGEGRKTLDYSRIEIALRLLGKVIPDLRAAVVFTPGAEGGSMAQGAAEQLVLSWDDGD